MLGGIAALLGLPTEALALFLALTVARPLGLFFGFVAFGWAMQQSFLLRIGLAFAIGLPVSIALRPEIAALATQATLLDLVLLVPKEFALGYGLGILASLPLLALQIAGEITDNFRGEGDSGLTDPTGGRSSTWGTWFLVIGILVFVLGGGLQALIGVLYESYLTWPATRMLPPLTMASVGTVLDLLAQMLRAAILVAAPLLIILMAVELSLAIASRLAQRYQLMSLEFAAKNLVAVLLMPVMVAFLLQYLAGSPVDFDQVIGALRTMLP